MSTDWTPVTVGGENAEWDDSTEKDTWDDSTEKDTWDGVEWTTWDEVDDSEIGTTDWTPLTVQSINAAYDDSTDTYDSSVGTYDGEGYTTWTKITVS